MTARRALSGEQLAAFRAAGSDGGCRRARQRQAALAREEEIAAALAIDELERGLPAVEAAWSLGVMAFHIRKRWPTPRRGGVPVPSSVERYLAGAIRRRLLPPVITWARDGASRHASAPSRSLP